MSASSTILNTIQTEIVNYSDYENLKKFCRVHPQYDCPGHGIFSRDRDMTFSDLFKFLLYPRSKSTDIELLEYSRLIGKHNVNKSDFSRRRRYIPAAYLKDLNRSIISSVYRSCDVSLWHNHAVLAGDGTTYSLPDTPAIRNIYLQGRKTGKGYQPLARGVVLKDVINDLVVASNMECYGKDEIGLLSEELEKLPQSLRDKSPVVVLDRKYCAYTLIEKMIQLGLGYIVRVKERFNSEVDAFSRSEKKEEWITLHPSRPTIKKLKRIYGKKDYSSFRVRVFRVSPSVVVMTNIMDDLLSDDGSNIYQSRWDDETTVGFFKNCLQIEIFSGISDNALQQDFHAKTILYNVLSYVCRQAATLRHDDRDRLINRNVALGIVKLDAITVLTGVENSYNNSLHIVLNQIARFSVPLKKFRSNVRAFRKIKHNGKYITLTNYRRAI